MPTDPQAYTTRTFAFACQIVRLHGHALEEAEELIAILHTTVKRLEAG